MDLLKDPPKIVSFRSPKQWISHWEKNNHPKQSQVIYICFVVSTPLKNMKVRLDHRPNYWGKKNIPSQQSDISQFFLQRKIAAGPFQAPRSVIS